MRRAVRGKIAGLVRFESRARGIALEEKCARVAARAMEEPPSRTAVRFVRAAVTGVRIRVRSNSILPGACGAARRCGLVDLHTTGAALRSGYS